MQVNIVLTTWAREGVGDMWRGEGWVTLHALSAPAPSSISVLQRMFAPPSPPERNEFFSASVLADAKKTPSGLAPGGGALTSEQADVRNKSPRCWAPRRSINGARP